MAKTRGRLFDRNRLVKRYPYVRAPKRNVFVGDKNVEIETIRVSFNGEITKNVVFEKPFKSNDYRVSLTARQTVAESVDSAMVSLAIESASISTTGFTINASSAFTGEVDVLVIRLSGTS